MAVRSFVKAHQSRPLGIESLRQKQPSVRRAFQEGV